MDEIIDESLFANVSIEEKSEIVVQKTGLENSFNERQIGSIAISIEPIGSYAPLDTALELFEKQADLKAIPVEENDHVIGVIERSTVEEVTNSAFKRLVTRNCDEYVTRTDFTIDCNEFIEKVEEKVNKKAFQENIKYFIVLLHNRSYYGIVSVESINEKIAQIRENDLSKAESIQQNMLKANTNVKNQKFDVCIFNRMANSVGGDFYVAMPICEDKFVAGSFDVSGKNVSAALLTVTIASFFTMFSQLNKGDISASALVAKLDQYLSKVVPVGNFITGTVCYVDSKNNFVQVFNCGHTNAFVFLPGEGGGKAVKIATLSPTLPPFGMGVITDSLKTQSKTNYKLAVMNGMQINLYSDGFTDMQNEEGIRYDDENTKSFFKELFFQDKSISEKFIEKTVDDWTYNAVLADDITVMNIRF